MLRRMTHYLCLPPSNTRDPGLACPWQWSEITSHDLGYFPWSGALPDGLGYVRYVFSSTRMVFSDMPIPGTEWARCSVNKLVLAFLKDRGWWCFSYFKWDFQDFCLLHIVPVVLLWPQCQNTLCTVLLYIPDKLTVVKGYCFLSTLIA